MEAKMQPFRAVAFSNLKIRVFRFTDYLSPTVQNNPMALKTHTTELFSEKISNSNKNLQGPEKATDP